MAEFIGTFLLVFFGCGAVILGDTGNSTVFTPLVFGGIVSVVIYAVGHISGAHLNPAVTIAFCVAKRFPFIRVFGYVTSQTAGAILASIVHASIFGADHSFGVTGLSVSVTNGMILEFILSFTLMFVIFSVATDSRAVGEMAGIAIGSTVALCAIVGGPLTGASMNPARSLGPALAAGNYQHLWLYLCVPILGAAAGAKTYEWIQCQRQGDDSAHGCC